MTVSVFVYKYGGIDFKFVHEEPIIVRWSYMSGLLLCLPASLVFFPIDAIIRLPQPAVDFLLLVVGLIDVALVSLLLQRFRQKV